MSYLLISAPTASFAYDLWNIETFKSKAWEENKNQQLMIKEIDKNLSATK